MGLDYSLHPIDPDLFRDRLVPYAMGRGDISDVLDAAVHLASVRHRSTAWANAEMELSKALKKEQAASAPALTHTYREPGKQTLLCGLLGRKPPTVSKTIEVEAASPGIPALDPDLHVWGRPFFNTAQDSAAALAVHRAFVDAANQPMSRADDICRTMIDSIDKRRSAMPPSLHASVIEKINNAPPYLSMIALDNARHGFDAVRARKVMDAEWWLIRAIWDRRKSDKPFDMNALDSEARELFGLQEERSDWIDVSENADDKTNFVSAKQALAALPYRITNAVSELQPGWMGDGRAYTSSLFATIKVDARHLFQTPAPLFQELIEADPATGRMLTNSIADNYTLGGYVPPDKVPALVALLEQHQQQIIHAWIKGQPNHYALQGGLTDYLKNLEPAAHAASKGWGFLEAAEIYSGFFGVAN